MISSGKEVRSSKGSSKGIETGEEREGKLPIARDRVNTLSKASREVARELSQAKVN